MARTLLRREYFGVVVAVAGAAGCLGSPAVDVDGTTGSTTEPPDTDGEVTQMGELALTSTAFDDGEPIPDRFGKSFENVNPPLEVSGVPDDAASLALVVDDPDAPSGVFDHRLVWNIPPDTTEIPAGWEPPNGVVEGTNDFGNVDYDGPRPPSKHTYRFKLYALESTLDLERGADKTALEDAMDGHVLAQTQLTGTFAPS